MADHTEILRVLTTLEKIHRKKFIDEEKARVLTALRKAEAVDVQAAEEPLCQARFLPKYGEIIAAVEQAKTARLGLSAPQIDDGPEPDDAALAKIKRRIGPVRFKAWFANAKIRVDQKAKTAALAMPSSLAVDFVKRDMTPEIAAALNVDFVEVSLKERV